MSKEFYTRLAEIQRTLNTPKGQFNSFGKYYYRSCEDILEGVKPLLDGLFLSISDEIVPVGDRYYVRATASITDGETTHTATAMAREEESKKGMDAAQVTGATSSYARKYCLNGLFGIDDSKDADAETHSIKPADADQILAEFTQYASSEIDSKKLQERYAQTWTRLNGFADHQTKCKDVTGIRIKELKQAA